MVKKPGVEKSRVETSGVEKAGVEKSDDNNENALWILVKVAQSQSIFSIWSHPPKIWTKLLSSKGNFKSWG